MRTTPELIARVARELIERLRGAKVRDVGLLPDGRTAIVLWSHGRNYALCIDIFGTPPLVTLEDEELPIGAEPGFIRALGAALRATALLDVKSRKDDRLLRLTFGTRSRFGVGDELELYIELVPKFGNMILVKRDTVVSAAKEFTLAENGTRTIAAGMPYMLPPMIARTAPPPSSDIAPDASVLDAFRAFREARVGSGDRARTAQRRQRLSRALAEREGRILKELQSMESKRQRANEREVLRTEGNELFATLHTLSDDRAREEAKDRAAALFAQYKKLGASIPHLDQREALLRTQLQAVETLRWEVERAEDRDLDDVEQAIASLDSRAHRAAPPAHRRRKRAPMEIRTANGSRILIGRSPLENADLTFHVARPSDLWFHAQNIPGAHVILARDDREEPSDEDIARAASLAAFYSKARASAKVLIDFTERKFVRAQRNAPPGLVWYTHPRTILAEPQP